MHKQTYVVAAVAFVCLGSLAVGQPIDFTEFTVDHFPLMGGFPEARWDTTSADRALLIDESDFSNPFNPIVGSFNASASVLHGPDNILGKRITGKVSPGWIDTTREPQVDNDVIGFVLGFQPQDASTGFEGTSNADYLLIDWKGEDEVLEFVDPDPLVTPVPHHDTTASLVGEAFMPAGLAISRVRGLPTADELWQHANLGGDDEQGSPLLGRVDEIARGNNFGSTGYSRDVERAPYQFDITYTANRVTVFVDGNLELDITGSFPDGRFGLYTLAQGPTPVFSDFAMIDSVDFPIITINRDTGEVVVQNSGSSSFDFTQLAVTSVAGALDSSPGVWTSITGNYDDGSAGSVDSDPWAIDSQSVKELSESELPGFAVEGASLAPGQSVSLGNIWNASRFEDLAVSVDVGTGQFFPLLSTYIGNTPSYSPADLDTDGDVDFDDWLLFFPNSLGDFSQNTLYEAALLGDLDGDLDNDRDDFTLFKDYYDMVNGSGAFAAALSGTPVPEPSAVALAALILAVAVSRRTLRVCVFVVLLCVATHQSVNAQPVDFTTFTVEAFPDIDFPDSIWELTESVARIGDADMDGVADNASPSVVYSPTNLLNTRFRGTIKPGGDDDVVGLVFGFMPGDAGNWSPEITEEENPLTGDYSNTDYLLLDWKGADQTFNFVDQPLDFEFDFNSLTPGGFMPAGLALSRVSGLPTMDDLWQHTNEYVTGQDPDTGDDILEDLNPLGGVTEIARASSLGSTGYDSGPPPESYEVDVVWREDVIIVEVDGVEQFREFGDYSDGRFGLYTCCQSGTEADPSGATFSNFELLPAFDVRGVVDPTTGDIVVTNVTDVSFTFDQYQVESAGGSLLATWSGLADAETGNSANPGVAWVEAGQANSNILAELFLEDALGSTSGFELAAGGSFTLEGAYNGALNTEDLLMTLRRPDGSVSLAFIDYAESSALAGDYNGDGMVNLADYTVWRDNLGGTSLPFNETSSPGVVDVDDYTTWKNNFGNLGGAVNAVSAAQVPEPASLSSASGAIFLFSMLGLRRSIFC